PRRHGIPDLGLYLERRARHRGFCHRHSGAPVPTAGPVWKIGGPLMKTFLVSLGAPVLLLLALFLLGGYETNVLMIILFFVILAVGLDLVSGYCGQFSFATGSFYGLGAYTAAIMSRDLGTSIWIHLPAGALV